MPNHMEGYYIVGSILLVSFFGMFCIIMDMIYPSHEEINIVMKKQKPIVIEKSILSSEDEEFNLDSYMDDSVQYTE